MYCQEEDQILTNMVQEIRSEPSIFKMIFELKRNLPSDVILNELKNLERGFFTKYSYNMLNAIGYGSVVRTKYSSTFARENNISTTNKKIPFYKNAKYYTMENGVSTICSIACEYIPMTCIRELKRLIQIQIV